MREEQVPLFYVTAVSTVLIFINLFTILGLLDHFDIITFSINKYTSAISLVVIGLINYFLFVRQKQFLNYNFERSRKGDVWVIMYFILTIMIFIAIAKQHRMKVLKDRAVRPIQHRVV